MARQARLEAAAAPQTPSGAARTTAALAALGLATFAYVTTENIPVGLLPQIAHDLHRSRSATGYLVTGYAAVVVLTSVPLVLATRRFSRRRLLQGALSLFVLGAAAGAAAQTYGELLATRVAIALSHAVFWAVVAAAAAALVPPERRGQALGMVFSGSSLASVLGIPAATWVGQQTSWRVSTLAASMLGLLALGAVAALLPETPPADEVDAAPHPDGRRYAVVLGALGLAVGGAFVMLTYVTVFLLGPGGFSSGAISPILLVSGVAGVIGVAVSSRFVARHARETMAAGVAMLAVSLLLLAAFAYHGAIDIALLGCFGFSFSVLAVGVQSRVLDVSPGSVNVGSAGNSAMFNVGIGGGALAGGLLLGGPGVRAIPVVGGALALASLATLLAEPWLVRRR